MRNNQGGYKIDVGARNIASFGWLSLIAFGRFAPVAMKRHGLTPIAASPHPILLSKGEINPRPNLCMFEQL